MAFSQGRVSEMHALAALDLDAPFRLGRRGAWRPAFLGTQFHVLLWTTAAKVCSCIGCATFQGVHKHSVTVE